MVEKFTTGNITILKPSNDFEMVPGAIIRNNPSVTIGVYCKLLSFGENWKLNVKGLATTLELSQNVVRQALTNLEEQGFLTRKPRRNEKGVLKGWDYVVYGNCLPEEERTVLSKTRNTVKSVIRQNPQYGETRNTENREGNINIPVSNVHTDIVDIHTQPHTTTRARAKFVAPSVYDIEAYCREANLTFTAAQTFFDHYESCGWKTNRGVQIVDWKAAARKWNTREKEYQAEKQAKKAAARNETAIETTLREMRDWDKTPTNNPFFDGSWNKQ